MWIQGNFRGLSNLNQTLKQFRPPLSLLTSEEEVNTSRLFLSRLSIQFQFLKPPCQIELSCCPPEGLLVSKSKWELSPSLAQISAEGGL